MKTHRLAVGLLVPGMIAGSTIWACGEDTNAPVAPVDASGGGVDTGTRADTGTTGNDSGVGPADAKADVDATPPQDAGVDAPYTTCKTLKDGNPALPSGTYALDLDKDGTVYPPLNVYCDMTFAGGGWTLIESFTGAQTTSALTPAFDAGYLLAVPQPGSAGALAGWMVAALAANSTQVHIRYSFVADAGAADPDGGAWITSRAPVLPTEVTVPMKNLRNLDTMSKGTDGGFPDWVGPQANALKMSWTPLLAGCQSATDLRKYPDVLWSCGNFESVNVISERVSFRWNDGTNQPLEVYVR